MQFNSTFWTSFSMFSKHLEFLSFQIVHHILAETILNLFLSFAFSKTFLGIVQEMPLRFENPPYLLGVLAV